MALGGQVCVAALQHKTPLHRPSRYFYTSSSTYEIID
jgi:hypothetical protein